MTNIFPNFFLSLSTSSQHLRNRSLYHYVIEFINFSFCFLCLFKKSFPSPSLWSYFLIFCSECFIIFFKLCRVYICKVWETGSNIIFSSAYSVGSCPLSEVHASTQICFICSVICEMPLSVWVCNLVPLFSLSTLCQYYTLFSFCIVIISLRSGRKYSYILFFLFRCALIFFALCTST